MRNMAQVAPALIRLLEDADEWEPVRSAAACTVGRFEDGTAEAVPALTAMLKDGSGELRQDAAIALIDMARPRRQCALLRSDDRRRRRRAKVLVGLGASAVPALLPLLREDDAGAVRAALAVLAAVGPAAAAPSALRPLAESTTRRRRGRPRRRWPRSNASAGRGRPRPDRLVHRNITSRLMSGACQPGTAWRSVPGK